MLLKIDLSTSSVEKVEPTLSVGFGIIDMTFGSRPSDRLTRERREWLNCQDYELPEEEPQTEKYIRALIDLQNSSIES